MSATIVVIDDDAYMRELMSLHLSNAGYQVLLAEDAVVAGHLVLEQRADLILSDIEMPFMDGLEFLQALKAHDELCAIPVVVVSSMGDCEDRAKALGAAAFLRKPVLAADLLATVAQQLGAARLALQAPIARR